VKVIIYPHWVERPLRSSPERALRDLSGGQQQRGLFRSTHLAPPKHRTQGLAPAQPTPRRFGVATFLYRAVFRNYPRRNACPCFPSLVDRRSIRVRKRFSVWIEDLVVSCAI